MRVKTALVILTMILAGLYTPATAAEAHDDGSSRTIDSSQTWSNDGTLNGKVTIIDGGVLTIDGSIDVEAGSEITVESGGSLLLNGDLNAAESTNEVYMEVYQNTFLEPYFEGLIDSGTMRINMAKEFFTSMEVHINVTGTNITWNGDNYVDFAVEFDDAPTNVNFSGFWQFPVWIDSIQAFDSNGAIYTLDADEWNHNNGVLKTEEGEPSFSITVAGEFSSSGGTISGADISCLGSCSITNSTLLWSAPINVYDNGQLTAETSIINGSRSYEDIIVHDSATIVYNTETMTGTGGPTDMWIRLLSQRIIETNLKDAPASVHFEGLGYLASNGDLMLDGNGTINLGESSNPTVSKYLRMVEWVDSSGMLSQEDGLIMITLNGGSSVWNSDYSITLDPAPATPTYVTNIELPFVVIDEVAPEDTQGIADRGLGVMLTVSNTGNVDVSTNIRCYEGADEADMATIFVTLSAGQTKEVPAVWYANSSGAKSLNCKVSIPSFFGQLSGDLASLDGTDSELVSFKEAEDREDAPLILYSAIVIVIIIATVLFTRASANKLNDETQKDYEREEVSDAMQNTED